MSSEQVAIKAKQIDHRVFSSNIDISFDASAEDSVNVSTKEFYMI